MIQVENANKFKNIIIKPNWGGGGCVLTINSFLVIKYSNILTNPVDGFSQKVEKVDEECKDMMLPNHMYIPYEAFSKICICHSLKTNKLK